MNFSIKQILQENWANYIKNHKVTHHQIKEIEKTINCNKTSCNSRICSSCGKRYADEWSHKLKYFIFPVEHKHLVLTVPEVLRKKLTKWNNLKLLMDSSNTFLKSIFG